EPGRDLALGLVDGVADLLAVDFGDDIETRHTSRVTLAAPPPEPVGAGRWCVVGADSCRNPRSGRYDPEATIEGSVPEWPKGTGCKPVGIAFEGSNPSRPTQSLTTPPGSPGGVVASRLGRHRCARAPSEHRRPGSQLARTRRRPVVPVRAGQAGRARDRRDPTPPRHRRSSSGRPIAR